MITAAVIAGIALASFVMSPFLFPFCPLFDVLDVFVPILTFISCRVALNTLPMPLELN